MIVDNRRPGEYNRLKFGAPQGARSIFTIYQDHWKASDIKIHRSDCSTYTNRVPASSVTWHYASNYQIARDMAKDLSKKDGTNYRDCILCKPSEPVMKYDL